MKIFDSLILCCFLISSAAFAKQQFDLVMNRMSKTSSCDSFMREFKDCKPNFCQIAFGMENQKKSMSFKTRGMEGDKCQIFFSDKEEHQTTVTFYKLDAQQMGYAYDLLSNYLGKSTQFKIKGIDNCCHETPTNKTGDVCDIEVNEKKLKAVFNLTNYQDCKGNFLVPINSKVIKY